MNRWIEVFTGAYASGKSETAINRALTLHNKQIQLTLVDLDTVEPAYTLRPIKKNLQKMGLSVVAHDREDSFGLGEAGTYITPEQKMCLHREENLIIDVGYGSGGVDVLFLLEDILLEPNLKIYMVINPCKFETSSVENIIEHIKWSTEGQKHTWIIDGLICNPNFSEHTTIEDIQKGYLIVKEASKILETPIKAINVLDSLYDEFLKVGIKEAEIWKIKRYMPEALW